MHRTSILLAVLLVASACSPVKAQTEFFSEGLVYSLSGFSQRFSIDDEEYRALGVEIAGMPVPEFGFSFGFGQTTVSQEFEEDETVTSISLGASFIANQARTASPLSAEVGVGLGYGIGNEGRSGATVGLIGVRLSLAMDPEQPILVAPSVQAAVTFPIGTSSAEQTFSFAPGIGIGLRLARGFVVYARPNYTFVSGGEEESYQAFGVALGITLLQ
ncbi:MAG: hypothetical protein ABJF88_02535 [Rhodothermales bacterium]